MKPNRELMYRQVGDYVEEDEIDMQIGMNTRYREEKMRPEERKKKVRGQRRTVSMGHGRGKERECAEEGNYTSSSRLKEMMLLYLADMMNALI